MLKFIASVWLVWFIGAILWVVNIVKLCLMLPAISDAHAITGLFIARIAGIFVPPLGAILAFF